MYLILRHAVFVCFFVCLSWGRSSFSLNANQKKTSLVFDKKAEKEEKLLVGLHGTAYEEYCEAVAKFVPRFY